MPGYILSIIEPTKSGSMWTPAMARAMDRDISHDQRTERTLEN